MASGGVMALTRDPSGRRASTMGEDASTGRPRADAGAGEVVMRAFRGSGSGRAGPAGRRLLLVQRGQLLRQVHRTAPSVAMAGWRWNSRPKRGAWGWAAARLAAAAAARASSGRR